MRSHRFAAALALAGVLALSAPAAAQQAPAGEAATAAIPAAAPVATDGAPSSNAAVQAPSTSSGLPSEPAPPRTLRAYWHVWIAFTLAWVLLFGYVVSIARRWSRVERDLDTLGRGAGVV